MEHRNHLPLHNSVYVRYRESGMWFRSHYVETCPFDNTQETLTVIIINAVQTEHIMLQENNERLKHRDSELNL